MRYLKTTEAAAVLGVGPSTLRAWEWRFGFPKPQRSLGGHRYYTHGEVAALRDALQGGLSSSAAVMRAPAGLAGDADSLVRALLAYDRGRADRAIETALALRSVEGSVEEVVLLSLDEIVRRRGGDSAAWAFSARGRMSGCAEPHPGAAAIDPARPRVARRARSGWSLHSRA